MPNPVVDTATEWAFGAGWQAVKWLPEPAAYRLFDVAADGIWRRRGAGVRQFERNQARIHPDLDAAGLADLSRRGMRSYLRYWCEAFRLPTWSRERVTSTFSLERDELMDAEMSSGRGVIMVVNHGGNWDHAGAWACLRYGGLTTVAERLRPEGLFDKFVAYRESLGMEVLPLGAPDVMRTLARRLEEGRLLAIVGDRDISRNGVPVRFFGETATMPPGSAALSILTGAAMLPVTLWFDGPRATGYIHDAIPIPEQGTKQEKVQVMTQGLADAFEQGIAQHSVDWHVMQPLWQADLDPARRRPRDDAEA
jgi:KDO2-lipid IV(A) lauroyltransferase